MFLYVCTPTGLSAQGGRKYLKTLCGTVGYTAPEVYADEKGYTEKVCVCVFVYVGYCVWCVFV